MDGQADVAALAGRQAAERIGTQAGGRRRPRRPSDLRSRLAQSVVDYRNGLHAAAEDARPFRWLLPIVLVVGVVTAAWDAVFGTWGNAIASAIYLVMLLVELFWWPKRQRQLLDNADRAAEMARDSAE